MHNIQTHKRGKLYNLKETNKKIGAYIHVSLSLRIINTVSCFISTMLKFNDFLRFKSTNHDAKWPNDQ